ncbi:MAG: type IV toxin-antitoxin system AbiEi family antitoxin [Deltaproteobacteria bacterium]|nr:type IV toxin-antitoxin system AbiEi family antitoxin [Deltaproteobacteria bacterium]
MEKLAMERLAQVFSATGQAADFEVEAITSIGDRHHHWEAFTIAGGRRFVVECKSSGSLSHIAMAVSELSVAPKHFPEPVIPLLTVPYMGETARAHCEQNGVAWLDLSGNGRIVAPGIFYQEVGHPNRFTRRGRPESAFGPKGSRITRRLLMDPGTEVRQRDLATSTGLNEGHVSRIVSKLADDGLIERVEGGIRVVDADLLVDAWREEYRFDRHTVIPGHVAARSGDELLRSITAKLSETEVSHAVTGLPGAWLWTKYAGFRLVTVYLADIPSAGLLTDLGFREEARGANTWLVVPNDQGVFHGAIRVDGVRCVHPVQVYLDLKSHPERANEAADELRSQLLSGGRVDR